MRPGGSCSAAGHDSSSGRDGAVAGVSYQQSSSSSKYVSCGAMAEYVWLSTPGHRNLGNAVVHGEASEVGVARPRQTGGWWKGTGASDERWVRSVQVGGKRSVEGGY